MRHNVVRADVRISSRSWIGIRVDSSAYKPLKSLRDTRENAMIKRAHIASVRHRSDSDNFVRSTARWETSRKSSEVLQPIVTHTCLPFRDLGIVNGRI